jgi:hypothetical protein
VGRAVNSATEVGGAPRSQASCDSEVFWGEPSSSGSGLRKDINPVGTLSRTRSKKAAESSVAPFTCAEGIKMHRGAGRGVQRHPGAHTEEAHELQELHLVTHTYIDPAQLQIQ